MSDGTSRRRRRHRRAVAPATNPSADQSDDLPGERSAGTGAGKGQHSVAGPGSEDRSVEPDTVDPRDAWIQAQRPPHWD